jgi:hypothetical protein
MVVTVVMFQVMRWENSLRLCVLCRNEFSPHATKTITTISTIPTSTHTPKKATDEGKVRALPEA